MKISKTKHIISKQINHVSQMKNTINYTYIKGKLYTRTEVYRAGFRNWRCGVSAAAHGGRRKRREGEEEAPTERRNRGESGARVREKREREQESWESG